MPSVLAISYTLPPHLYPQSIQIGRLLGALKARCKLCVVTADERGGPLDATLMPRLFDGMEDVLRIPRFENRYLSAAKERLLPVIFLRPDLHQGWMRQAEAAILRHYQGRRFDCVATFSYPASTNLLGLSLQRRLGVRWIAHNSDPWADNPVVREGAWSRRNNRRLEAEAFGAADALLFTSAETVALYRDRYPHRAPVMHALNHAFDPADFPHVDRAARPSGQLVTLRYLGSFYGPRTPAPLFAALRLLTEDERSRLRIEIVGGGRRVPALREAFGVSACVSLRPGVGYTESLRLMVESDILLVIDAPSTQPSVFFPSKLADYIGAGRPLLGISPPGTTQRILTGLGQPCADTTETEAIAALLRRIAAAGGADWAAPAPAQTLPYRIDHTVAAFAEILGLSAPAREADAE